MKKIIRFVVAIGLVPFMVLLFVVVAFLTWLSDEDWEFFKWEWKRYFSSWLEWVLFKNQEGKA